MLIFDKSQWVVICLVRKNNERHACDWKKGYQSGNYSAVPITKWNRWVSLSMSKITALNSIAATLKFSSMSADEPQKSTMSVVVTLFFGLCYIMTPTDDTAILFFFSKAYNDS